MIHSIPSSFLDWITRIDSEDQQPKVEVVSTYPFFLFSRWPQSLSYCLIIDPLMWTLEIHLHSCSIYYLLDPWCFIAYQYLRSIHYIQLKMQCILLWVYFSWILIDCSVMFKNIFLFWQITGKCFSSNFDANQMECQLKICVSFLFAVATIAMKSTRKYMIEREGGN
jgi:hypothetical protein